MNPRIHELMKEAGFAAPELAGRAQRLAEYLIQECIAVLKDNIDRRIPASRYPDIIKHYFGD